MEGDAGEWAKEREEPMELDSEDSEGPLDGERMERLQGRLEYLQRLMQSTEHQIKDLHDDMYEEDII